MTTILLIACLALLGYVAWKLTTNKTDAMSLEAKAELREIGTRVQDLAMRVEDKLHNTSERMHERLHQSASQNIGAIRDLTEKMTRLDETNKQVAGFAQQLQSLQDILKNPKQRGILGEYYLETTLKNVLPPGGYTMQYRFPDGLIADAVVHVRDKIIPIDSKFSLENYNKLAEAKSDVERTEYERAFKNDIKTRIDETTKYIRPNDDTMGFAFMFIPHESLYYDLLVAEIGTVKINTQDLIEYAFKKNVLIVSPTSFLAFLQTVLQGLKALQIEESAKEIRKNVEELSKHLGAYQEYHNKVGSTLSTVINHYNASTKELGKVDKDVTRITGSGMGTERIDLIDKPLLD
jgi:DNA recombination protein RmuC